MSTYAEARARAEARFLTALNNPRQVTDYDRDTLGLVEAVVLELGTLIEEVVPDGRDKSIALTALEDVLTRANKAIYRDGAIQYGPQSGEVMSDSGSARPIPREGTSLA